MAIIERPNDLARKASEQKALPILSEREIREHLDRPEVASRLKRVEKLMQERRSGSQGPR